MMKDVATGVSSNTESAKMFTNFGLLQRTGGKVMYSEIEEYWIQTHQCRMGYVLAYRNFETSVIFLNKIPRM